jgi:hypothetical protein
MPNFTTTNLTQLSRVGDGTTMGQSASDKIAFYGATPVVQQASTAAGTDATTTQALANALRTALLNLGLIA